MPWVTSGYQVQTHYPWVGVNYRNQRAALIQGVPGGVAITRIKVRAAGRGGSVATRLVIWDGTGSRAVLAQTSTFTMAQGSDSFAGQDWYDRSIGPLKVISTMDILAGFYHSPSTGSLWSASDNANNLYEKTRTGTFPSVTNMDGASNDRGYVGFVEVFYIVPPDAPANASVSRVSDTRQNLSWSRTNPTNEDKPYEHQRIQRWDNVTGSWYDLAIVPGSAASYADTTTQNNRRYRYRVRAENAAGNSGYSATEYIATTPAAMTNVVASRDGSDVSITWNNPATYATNLQLEHSVGGGDWTTLATLSGTATSHVHLDPGGGVHQYRIRAVTDGPLYSSWTTSNEVVTIQAPAAPSNLSPSGIALDGTESVNITWQHNPTDGTAQTAYEHRYRAFGDPTWISTGKINESVNAHSYLAGTFTNGLQYEHQVRTWGQHADPSDWSSSAFLHASSKPVAVITYPASDLDSHNNPSLTVSWLYSQEEDVTQNAFRVWLRDIQGETLHYRLDSSAAESYVIPYALQDGLSYTVEVQVKNSLGLWGEVTARDFTVDYALPEAPVLIVQANLEEASVLLEITNPIGDPATVHNEVYRQVGDGPWVKIADEVPIDATMTDYIPGLDTQYMVVAVSEIESVAQSNAEKVQLNMAGQFWINAGPGFSERLKVFEDASYNASSDKDKVLHRFEGRTYPVEYQGTARNEAIQITGLIPIEKRMQAESILHSDGPIYYRDHYGRHWLASASGVRWQHSTPGFVQLRVTITRLDGDGYGT